MKKMTSAEKQQVKKLNTQIKGLQANLVVAEKREGKDPYIEVKVRKNQGRPVRVKKKDADDTFFARYFIEITIMAERQDIFVPLSIASGKKVAGFMYQIEGTAAGSIETASVEVKGKGVSLIVVGTLRYAKILKGTTASFEVRASVRGSAGKAYKLVFTRLNYKLQLSDVRYQQYLKEIHSENVKLG